MTRRDWWLGIGLLVGALVWHAAWPRYECRITATAAAVARDRVDRWTGQSVGRCLPPD